MLAKNKPEITCGQIRVSFVARKNMERTPTIDFKIPRGYLKISTPEATAYDLVGYPSHGAGLDNVTTVLAELAELAEKLNGKELARLAELSPVAWAQRLGYFLELVGAREKTLELAQYITMKNPPSTPLSPSLPVEGRNRLKPWNLLVNTLVEPDV